MVIDMNDEEELEELNVFGWELACEIREKIFEKYPNCDQETINYLLEEIECQFSNKEVETNFNRSFT